MNDLTQSDEALISYEANCLTFSRQPAWEEAETIVDTLLRMNGAIQWWIGDAILMFEGIFPQNYEQLFPDGYAAKSLANMRWVAMRIPPARRREGLSWSHHAPVAPLEEALQEELLEMALAEGWTVKQIREAARAAQGKLPAPKPKPVTITVKCPECEHEFDCEIE